MPLLDHFHPPLSDHRHWESFFTLWAIAIADVLNESLLPPHYFAEIRIKINDPAVQTGQLPVPEMSFPAAFPDEIEVQVFSTEMGPTLVAAVELVSPGNKDRPDARRALAAKCVGYLTAGIGLVLVDVVTNRGANLHNEMLGVMNLGAPYLLSDEVSVYAVAYRPALRGEQAEIDAWPHALAVESTLPTVPLALRNDGCVPLDLEATYTDARRRGRIE